MKKKGETRLDISTMFLRKIRVNFLLKNKRRLTLFVVLTVIRSSDDDIIEDWKLRSIIPI